MTQLRISYLYSRVKTSPDFVSRRRPCSNRSLNAGWSRNVKRRLTFKERLVVWGKP